MKNNRDSFWIALPLGLMLVVALWLVSPWVATQMLSVSAKMGVGPPGSISFGDQFNVINTLFTGLAFGIIAISLWYQRRDIQIQQDALKDQKGIFERQLRLAATKEVVDSLPHFDFTYPRVEQDQEGMPSSWISFKNDGAEIYNITFRPKDPKKWQIDFPAKEFHSTTYNQAFIVRWMNGQETNHFAEFAIICELRSGETAEVWFIIDEGEVKRTITLKDLINDILERREEKTRPST